MSGDEQAEYRTSGIYGEIAAKPFKDANGTTWRDQNGQPMTATDHFEQATGQRVTRTPFNGLNRPELWAATRTTTAARVPWPRSLAWAITGQRGRNQGAGRSITWCSGPRSGSAPTASS